MIRDMDDLQMLRHQDNIIVGLPMDQNCGQCGEVIALILHIMPDFNLRVCIICIFFTCLYPSVVIFCDSSDMLFLEA